MQRHKSKVMRRSRRKGRTGTRKQTGGLFGFLTNMFNPAPATGAPGAPGAPPPGATPAPGAPPGATPAPGAPPATGAPAKKGWFGLWGGSSRKKTQRHHRRRRHHRK